METQADEKPVSERFHGRVGWRDKGEAGLPPFFLLVIKALPKALGGHMATKLETPLPCLPVGWAGHVTAFSPRGCAIHVTSFTSALPCPGWSTAAVLVGQLPSYGQEPPQQVTEKEVPQPGLPAPERETGPAAVGHRPEGSICCSN